MAKDRLRLKAVNANLLIKEKEHAARSALLRVQQERIRKAKAEMQQERRDNTELRTRLLNMNREIKKASKYIKKIVKQTEDIASASIQADMNKSKSSSEKEKLKEKVKIIKIVAKDKAISSKKAAKIAYKSLKKL